jgi:Protein of unknown function (DUF3108)
MTDQSSLETGVPNVLPHSTLVWEPEEFVFGLQYAARPAGTIRWLSGPGLGPDRQHWLIRVETNFTGVLGSVRRVQVSKLELSTGLPVSYLESDGGNGRAFETVFDRKSGLVTVHQHRDVASVALTQDYFDPLSVLQLLRTLPAETSSLRVPMVGGTVLIAKLPDETVQTPWGEVRAHVYYLRPGIGFVYIEADAPHRILKLGQAVGKFMLEGWLMRSGVPQVLPMQVERGRESVQQPRAQMARNQGPRARVQEGRRNRSDQNPERNDASRSGEARPAVVRAETAGVSQQTRTDQPRTEGGSKRGNRRRRRSENRTVNQDTRLEAGTPTPRSVTVQQNVGQPETAAGQNDSPRKRRRRRSRRGNARGGEGGGEA